MGIAVEVSKGFTKPRGVEVGAKGVEPSIAIVSESRKVRVSKSVLEQVELLKKVDFLELLWVDF